MKKCLTKTSHPKLLLILGGVLMEKTHNISGTVVKKGRKYFQVRLSTTQSNYLHKIVINSINKEWKVGDTFQCVGIPTWDYAYGSGKPYISFYTPVNAEDVRKDEIDRWMGYVKEAYKKGYVYEKGVAKLLELDPSDSMKNTIQRLRQKVEHNKRFVRFIDRLSLIHI